MILASVVSDHSIFGYILSPPSVFFSFTSTTYFAFGVFLHFCSPFEEHNFPHISLAFFPPPRAGGFVFVAFYFPPTCFLLHIMFLSLFIPFLFLYHLPLHTMFLFLYSVSPSLTVPPSLPVSSSDNEFQDSIKSLSHI